MKTEKSKERVNKKINHFTDWYLNKWWLIELVSGICFALSGVVYAVNLVCFKLPYVAIVSMFLALAFSALSMMSMWVFIFVHWFKTIDDLDHDNFRQ